MKTIIIAIRPKWVAKILNGEKIIELRKSMPSELPCRVLVYCTKSNDYLLNFDPLQNKETEWAVYPKKFVEETNSHRAIINGTNTGKIVAEFTLEEVKTIHDKPAGICDLNPNVPHPDWHHYYEMGLVSDKLLYGGDENSFSEEYGELLRKHSCLSQQQIFDYLNKDKNVIYGAKGYAWFISNLAIFDKPKDLADYGLKRAPQSWCYAKEKPRDRLGKKEGEQR